MKNIILILVFASLVYVLYSTNRYETEELNEENCLDRYTKYIPSRYSEKGTEIFPSYNTISDALDISETQLHSLPRNYFKRSNCVRKLRLDNNSLTTIPTTVQYLKRLEKLHLGQNKLKYDNNIYFKYPKSLKVLNLYSNNYLRFGVPVFEQMEVLNLSQNYISVLGVEEETNIKQIILHKNKIKDFPKVLHRVNGLKKLDLSNNRMRYLDLSIHQESDYNKRFEDLETLDVSNNALVAFPKTFHLMPKLKEIELDDNNIKGKVMLDNIDNLQIFSLSNQYVSSVVIEEHTGYELTIIEMINNNITNFETKSELPKLTDLYLTDNKLTTFPPTISKMPKLKYLSLAYNQINQVSDTLNINKLERIDLFNNQLTELPTFTAEYLRFLYLQHNYISVLDLDQLNASITDLNLSNNDIQVIKGTFKNLQLQKLNLSNNQKLRQFPISTLRRLTHLKELELENTSIEAVNMRAIIQYCRENKIDLVY